MRSYRASIVISETLRLGELTANAAPPIAGTELYRILQMAE